MTKRATTWMAFYVRDYLGDTLGLTTEEHGAYLLLIMGCWMAGGSLLDDDSELAAIAKLPPARWRVMSVKIRRFFSDIDGRLVHGRVAAEYAKAQELSDAKRGPARAGAEKRWGEGMGTGTRSQRLAAARAIATHTADEWRALVQAVGNICMKCRISAAELIGGNLCKDHIKPIYQGGSDGIENLQPLCRECNAGKGSEAVDYREIAAPGWRERLAKCLPNVGQTPAPTPSPRKGSAHKGQRALSDRTRSARSQPDGGERPALRLVEDTSAETLAHYLAAQKKD